MKALRPHNEGKHREPPGKPTLPLGSARHLTIKERIGSHSADRFYSLGSKKLSIALHGRDAPGNPSLYSWPQYTFRSSVRSRSATGTPVILYPQKHFLKRYITFNRKVYKFQIKGIYLLNGRYIPMGSRFARNVYRASEPSVNDPSSQ